MSNISSMFPNLNLSPATIAGLANASGIPASMPASDADMQSLAQRWNSIPEETPAAAPGPPVDGNAHSSPTAAKPVDPMTAPFGQFGAPAANASLQDMAHQFSAQDKGQAVPAPTPAHSQGMPITAVPAHWQPGSHSVSMQRGMTPQELESTQYNHDVAAGHELMGADKRYEAAQMRGAAEGAFAAAQGAAEQHYAQLQAAQEQRKKTYVANELEKLQNLNTQAQKEVDPKAYWKEKGALGTVLTGLMIGLGQFASMWKGGSNAALQIVNDQVAQNIDAQKANINNAHAALANERNLYRDNLDAFGDEERATLATKMQYLNHVATMVDQIKAGATDADTAAAKHEMIAKIYEHSSALAKEIADLSHTKITEQENEHFVPTQMLGGGTGGDRPSNVLRTSDGTAYQIDNPELYKAAVGKVQSLRELRRLTNNILADRAELAKLPAVGEESRRAYLENNLKQLTDDLMSAKSHAQGEGVVTKADAERIEKIGLAGDSDMSRWSHVNPWASSNRKGTDDAFRAMIDRWQATEHDYVTSASGKVVKTDYVRGPDGRLRPGGEYTGQDAAPTPDLAPRGSKPIDSRITNLPTQSVPRKDTIPKAPVRNAPYVPPTPPAPKKGHKK